MKWALVIAFGLLAISPSAELTRDGALDMLINASLYQTKCQGYVPPSAKEALNRLGDRFDIKLSNEIDAAKAIARMVKRSLEIEQNLAEFCTREKREVEELDSLGRRLG
jgi:hypothetical protein